MYEAGVFASFWGVEVCVKKMKILKSVVVLDCNQMTKNTGQSTKKNTGKMEKGESKSSAHDEKKQNKLNEATN